MHHFLKQLIHGSWSHDSWPSVVVLPRILLAQKAEVVGSYFIVPCFEAMSRAHDDEAD